MNPYNLRKDDLFSFTENGQTCKFVEIIDDTMIYISTNSGKIYCSKISNNLIIHIK
jgi:hypothetical protein